MKCVEARELLSLYIDKMLDEDEVREVEEHLSACEACRKEYNELKEIVDLLGRAEMVPVPAAFGFRLKKALKEEKQNMVKAGIIKGFFKGRRWRLVSSIAAVFAVGVLSFGLFHDIIGDLPGMFGSDDQAGAAPAEGDYDTYGGTVGGVDSATDSAALDAEKYKAQEEMVSDREIAASSNGAQTPTYSGAAGGGSSGSAGSGAEPYTGDQSAVQNNTKEEAAAGHTGTEDSVLSGPETMGDSGTGGSEGSDGTETVVPEYSMIAPVPDETSRSMTGPGLERSADPHEHYSRLIEAKLKNFDYQILSSGLTDTGEWEFRIFIFRDKDGNTYNEEIKIIGKEGEIKAIETNEFMEL